MQVVTEALDHIRPDLVGLRQHEGCHCTGGLNLLHPLGGYGQSNNLLTHRIQRFHLRGRPYDLGDEQTVPGAPGV